MIFLATPTRSAPTYLGSRRPTPTRVRRPSPRNALLSSGAETICTRGAKYCVAETLLSSCKKNVETLGCLNVGTLGVPPRGVSEVWQIQGLERCVFGSVAMAGVTGEFSEVWQGRIFGSVARKGCRNLGLAPGNEGVGDVAMLCRVGEVGGLARANIDGDERRGDFREIGIDDRFAIGRPAGLHAQAVGGG